MLYKILYKTFRRHFDLYVLKLRRRKSSKKPTSCQRNFQSCGSGCDSGDTEIASLKFFGKDIDINIVFTAFYEKKI